MTTTLRFAGTLDPTIALAIAIAATALVFLIYRLETIGMSLVARWLLPILRSAAVIMVIFLLAGPVLETTRRLGDIGKVVFVIDHSESMQHVDQSRDASRSSRILDLLESEKGLLTHLKATHDVEVVNPPLGGSVTNLSRMLEGAYAENSFENADSDIARTLILVSDGQNNDGDAPSEIATKHAAAGVAVSTWGFGDIEEPDDLAVLNVQYPESVSAAGRIRGTVQYKASGIEPEGAELEILIRDDSETVLWKETIQTQDTTDGEIPFEFPVESLVTKPTRPNGMQADAMLKQDLVRIKLTAEIRTTTDSKTSLQEIDTDNNQRSFAFMAVRSDYKILIIDGRSRWETRYLKNLFSRDPQWQTTTVIFSNKDLSGQQRAGDSEKIANDTLPESLERLLEYDLVCVGEVSKAQLDQRFLQWLTEYVDRGGGLVLVDGQRDHLRELFTENHRQLVPVDWLGEAKPFFADRIERTSIGQSTAWLSLGDTESQSLQQWGELQPPKAMRLVSPAKDAETLIEAELGSQKYPLVVTRAYGGGRIVYFASDETWRWRYKRADEVHSRFWNQLALALLQPPLAVGNEYAELDVDKAEYNSGESALVRVRLRSQDGTFKDDASVEAMLYRDGEEVQAFTLRPDGRLPGMYVGNSAPLDAGEYTLRFNAADYGQVASSLVAGFSVSPQVSGEQLRLRQHVPLLAEIATSGNGQYFAEDDVGKLKEYLMQRTAGKVELTQVSLWDSYYWFVPVILLLAVEWWLRKRWGLP